MVTEPWAILPLGYASYWALVWCGALLVSNLVLAVGRRSGLEAIACGLMSVPLWTAVWSFVDSIPVVVSTTEVLRPATPQRLSRMFYRSGLIDLGYVGAGVLVLMRARVGPLWRLRLRDVARHVGAWVPTLGRHRERDGAWAGYALFPLLLMATALANWTLTRAWPGLVSGDESMFWDHLTPYHAVAISVAAALTEEVVYRALLLTVLWLALRRAGLSSPWAAAVSVAGQAVLFALAHAGYGTWIHILLPLLFGLVAGAVAWWKGLWAAILLHFQVDLYVFLDVLPDATYPWSAPLLYGLMAVNVLALAAYALLALRRRRMAPSVA